MQFKLIQKKKEAGDAINFLFEPPLGFKWKAGQYVHYKLKHDKPDEKGEERDFTISTCQFMQQVGITTRINAEKPSSFKKALMSMYIGQEIEADGPKGDFILDDPRGKEYVFIAGGIGITPFHAMLTDYHSRNFDFNIKLLYANKTEDIVFKDKIEEIAAYRKQFKIHYYINPVKLSIERITKLIPEFKKPIFYLSGPEPMVVSLGKDLLAAGVAPDHLKTDEFPGYDGI